MYKYLFLFKFFFFSKLQTIFHFYGDMAGRVKTERSQSQELVLNLFKYFQGTLQVQEEAL